MNDTLIKPFKKQNVRETMDKWYPVINEEDIAELEAIPDEEPVTDELTTEGKPDALLLKIWNTQELLDTVSNNTLLAEQLIEQFINQSRAMLITAKESLYMSNFTVIAHIAHTLKGSSSAIAAGTLAEAAAKMEKAAKDKNLQDASDFINEFSAAFTKFAFLADEQISVWKRRGI